MRPVFRKNDFICLKKSLNLLWKIYYIVINVKEDYVEAVRCSTGLPNTFIYKMNMNEIVSLNKCSIQLCQYIQEQLDKWVEEIKNEDIVELYLKKNAETMHIINEDIKVITFYTKGDDKQFKSFEVIDNPQPVLLPNPYKSNSGRVRYEWIKIHIGRCFNVTNEPCVVTKNPLCREELPILMAILCV